MSNTAEQDTLIPSRSSRRDFLRASALGLAVPALAACAGGAEDDQKAAGASKASDQKPPAHPGGPHDATKPAPPTAQQIRMKADEMDAMHEKGVKSFPAATRGKGNQLMQPRMEGSVKVYDLVARKIQWEVEPGRMVEAWAYNDQVPGPMIRVREGDRVRVNLRNELEQSTVIHFHGVEVPNDQDGVPFITQPPIKPGESYTYEFTVPNAGSHMYHSHHNAATQVTMGLLGAFIVDPRDASSEPKADVDYTMIINDAAHGFTLNGKGFPATEPIVCKLGQTVRVRFMNEGLMIHPMHLHGMHMTVTHKDGWAQPAPWKCDTLNVAPGERWDVLIKADKPGIWAFHCHVLNHAESEHGMFGMVTALIVEK
jgi:FtsP/CotA-like multicopper oxidase with cupredoxin domain